MQRIIIALAALGTAASLAATPAAAQSAPPQSTPPGAPQAPRSLSGGATPTKAEQELLDLSRAKWRWMAEKKADTLAALFHENAVFVHMGGAWGRTQELAIIRGGQIHYKHAEIFEASARVIGNTGIVLNRIRLDAVVGGNAVTNPFVVTEVYVQQNGTWTLGALSFTRLLQ